MYFASFSFYEQSTTNLNQFRNCESKNKNAKHFKTFDDGHFIQLHLPLIYRSTFRKNKRAIINKLRLK